MQQRTKVLLAVVLALTMVLALGSIAQADDYSNHWSATYINDCVSRGWMTGDGSGNYRPDAAITRAEFAVMLWRAMGQPEPKAACPFTDVPTDAYYYKAVTALYEAGVVTGLDAVTFNPGGTVTREMGCTMLARAYSLTPANTNAYQQFTDYQNVSSWAQSAVSVLVEKSYISGVGDNQFAPKQQLKRGELAKLLVTVYDGSSAAATAAAQAAAIAAITQYTSGPTITLKQTALGSDEAKITVTVADSGSSATYVGWRSSTKDATYSSKSGFDSITSALEFTVKENGWYAVYAEDKNGYGSYKLIEVTSITDGPVISLTRTTVDTGTVQISVKVTKTSSSATIEYVGWRSSSEGATYSSKSSFTDITDDMKFEVTSNGWYAVCVVEKDGKFGYRLIEVTGINSDGPTISYTLNPSGSTKATSVTVTITVTPKKSTTVDWVGWRTSSEGTTYKTTTGFTKLSSPYTFNATDNRYYAVCATDNEGGFSYVLIEITNVGTATTHTVSFDSNGGTSVSSITGVPDGSTITEPDEPTRGGYTFGGWYTDAAFTTLWKFSTDTVKSNVTLYAKWTSTDPDPVDPDPVDPDPVDPDPVDPDPVDPVDPVDPA